VLLCTPLTNHSLKHYTGTPIQGVTSADKLNSENSILIKNQQIEFKDKVKPFTTQAEPPTNAQTCYNPS
jgi:hypothetical protein